MRLELRPRCAGSALQDRCAHHDFARRALVRRRARALGRVWVRQALADGVTCLSMVALAPRATLPASDGHCLTSMALEQSGHDRPAELCNVLSGGHLAGRRRCKWQRGGWTVLPRQPRKVTEVTHAVWSYSRAHVYSVWVTHPIAMFAGFMSWRDRRRLRTGNKPAGSGRIA